MKKLQTLWEPCEVHMLSSTYCKYDKSRKFNTVSTFYQIISGQISLLPGNMSKVKYVLRIPQVKDIQ